MDFFLLMFTSVLGLIVGFTLSLFGRNSVGSPSIKVKGKGSELDKAESTLPSKASVGFSSVPSPSRSPNNNKKDSKGALPKALAINTNLDGPSGTSNNKTFRTKDPSNDNDSPLMKPSASSMHLSSVGGGSYRAGRRLILVVNKLPLSLTRSRGGEWSCVWDDRRSVMANFRFMRMDQDGNEMDIVWVGYPGVEVPKEEQEQVEELLENEGCRPVFLPSQINDRFSNGFCKGVLWPLFHYSLPQASTSYATNFDDLWQAYNSANSLFATVVSRAVESPEDWIWVHNYPLLLVPGFLRNKLPKAKIGLFLHTPFPSSDVFRLLPTRSPLLTAVLSADLLGFHTFDYARHFLSCIKRVLDLDYQTLPGGTLAVKSSGRFVSILISHVGIDAPFFRQTAQSKGVQTRVQQIKSQFVGRRIMMGVEELDLVKGSLLKIQAFERFLDKFPHWAEKVVLLEILSPSRNVSDNEKVIVRKNLESTIASIRKKHGEGVIHIIDAEKQVVDVPELIAIYNSSDLALVTSFYDGLNLSPFEFTASQNQSNPGQLIVSEFMGCSRSLNGVFRVNPWSLDTTSQAINDALNLSLDERKANHHRRFNYVMSHTAERWADGFLFQLDRAAKLSSRMKLVTVGWGSSVRLVGVRADFEHVDEDKLTVAYRKASRRILLLDYDGTLTSAEKSLLKSKLVGPSTSVMNALKRLTSEPDTTVFIMSGRTRDCLSEWFDALPELGLAAEKGCFLRWPARFRHARAQILRRKSSDIRMLPNDTDEDSTATTNSTAVGNPNNRTSSNSTNAVRRVRSNSRSSNSSPSSSKPSSPLLSSRSLLVAESLENSLDLNGEWESMVSLEDIKWKSSALDIVKSYTEATDGSWIEDKEFAIVWHYEQADPEYGRMQASELEKYLIQVLNSPFVEIVKYDYNRILEVKPKGVSKGIAATAILEAVLSVNGNRSPIHHHSAQSQPQSPVHSLPVNQIHHHSLSTITGTGASTGTGSSPANQASAASPIRQQQRSPQFSTHNLSNSPQQTNSSLFASAFNNHAANNPDSSPFLLAVGDDRGDEDMFAAIQNRDDLKPKNIGAGPFSTRMKNRKFTGGGQSTHNSSNNLAGLASNGSGTQSAGNSPLLRNNNNISSPASDLSDDEDAMNKEISTKTPSDPFTFTICVGMKPSCAHYYVHDDEEVIRMLEALGSCANRLVANSQSTANNHINVNRAPNTIPTLKLPSSHSHSHGPALLFNSAAPGSVGNNNSSSNLHSNLFSTAADRTKN